MTDQVVQHDLGYYVYGIVPAGAPVPDERGLDDVPLEVVTRGPLAAVVSTLPLDRPPGRRAELLAHSRVVDALAEAGPVVPVQFGSVLEHDVAAVEELLAAQEAVATQALEDLRDKVQLNLRVSYVSEHLLADVVRSHPSIAELRRRTKDLPQGTPHPDLVRLGEEVAAAVEARRRHDAAAVTDAIAPHVVEIAEREGSGLEHVLDVALLVAHPATDGLEGLLEQLAEQEHERMRFRLVGPVAPYDFAGGSTWV
jgi:hypothetical protein